MIGNWVKNDLELAIAKTVVEKKIGDFNKEEMARVVEVMGKWRFLLGVSTECTELELTFICQFLYDEFKHLTLMDLTYAMNWSISGKIDTQMISKKTLSANYVSQCLNLYEDIKAATMNKIAKAKEAYENRLSIDAPTKVTPTEKANIFKDYIINCHERYSDRGKIDDYGNSIYRWLKSIGLIKPTAAEVEEAKEMARKRLRTERLEESNSFVRPVSKDPSTEEQKVNKYAREFMISKVFDKYEPIDLINRIKIEYFNDQQ